MFKYQGFLTPAYATKLNKTKDVPENNESCELPFSPDTKKAITYTPSKTEDKYDSTKLIRSVDYKRLNLFQRILEENFEPVNDDFSKITIINITLTEPTGNTVWRFITHAGYIVPPEMNATIYYETYIARIAVTERCEKKIIDGYSFMVHYGHDSKLNEAKEKIFREELIGSFLT